MSKDTLIVPDGQSVPVQFNSPCLTTLHGASNCGKSFLTHRILRHANDLYSGKTSKVLYCYSVHQPLFTRMENDVPGITFYKGLPNEAYLKEFRKDVLAEEFVLLVLDDLQSKILDSVEMVHIATVLSHHLNYNVILILQNLFANGKHSRTILLQSGYYISMRNLRDMSSLGTLSRQVFDNSRIIPEVMREISSRQDYPYVVIDLSPKTRDSRVRIRTDIFPGEMMELYVVNS